MASRRRGIYICAVILTIYIVQGAFSAPPGKVKVLEKEEVKHDIKEQHNKRNPNVDPDEENRQPPKHRTDIKHMRLSDHPDCPEIKKMCPTNMLHNNFATLECIMNELKSEDDLSKKCHHVLYSYKRNLTKDDRFDTAATQVCKSSFDQTTDCHDLKPGEGQIIPCLVDHLHNITDVNCQEFLEKMRAIIFADYRLIYKFAEHCQRDITKFQCGRVSLMNDNDKEQDIHSQGKTVACLEGHLKNVTKKCKKQILRIAELQSDDYHMDRPLYYACRDDREKFCHKTKSGSGKIYKCLIKHKFDKGMSHQCQKKLTVRQKLMQADYKVSHTLVEQCQHDIDSNGCMAGNVDHEKNSMLAHVLLCLEGALNQGNAVSTECQGEMTELRRMLMEDYMINPEIVVECQEEIKNQCHDKTLQRDGRTIHCLMDLARPSKANKFKSKISDSCRVALEDLIQETNPGENYQIDPVLQEACESVVQTACRKIQPGEGVIGCLMEHISEKIMTPECAEKLMEVQYFVSRDFRMDKKLYHKCYKPANTYCKAKWNKMGPLREGEAKRMKKKKKSYVFGCLYMKFKSMKWKLKKLDQDCAVEVRRVMHQRAVSVELNPRVEIPCMADLGQYCSDEKTEAGAEFECLQDHYDDLAEKCQMAIGNYTEDVDEDPNLDAILMKACEPMLEKFCGDALNQQHIGDDVDNDVMQCLIAHKRSKGMNDKCQIGIEHHQLTTLKDYRFSHHFKDMCKKDVMTFCKHSNRNKGDIISCLMDHVKNDTLLDVEHRVSDHCRGQLRVELFQRAESIKLDPHLEKACHEDVERFCQKKHPGDGSVIDCLKRNSKSKKFSKMCHKFLFKREVMEAKDARIDYRLNKMCKDMIHHYCKNVDPASMLSCLRKHKHDEDFDDECRNFITERQIERSRDYRLNPQLEKACHLDIKKFCKGILQAHEEGTDFEGKIINCLKKPFRKNRLSDHCEEHMESYMKNQALDYRQDPVLNEACGNEIKTMCAEEVKNINEGHGHGGEVEECLKHNFKKISKTSRCKMQVVELLAEGKVDVNVDPLLHRACSADIRHYCEGVEPGEGRVMSCLITALDDKTVRLSKSCKTMLQERRDLWGYAAQVAPADTFHELASEILGSRSRNYFLGIILAVIGAIFIFGLCFGRVTKRVSASQKNK